MSLFVDYLAEFGLDVGKDYIVDKEKEAEIKVHIRSYIERQGNINEMSVLAEEIDFQGLIKYISTTLLRDVEDNLFRNKSNREDMMKMIFLKAFSSSKANTQKQKERVKSLINGALDILYNFYRENINNKDWFVATEIIWNLEKNREDIKEEVQNTGQKVINELKEHFDDKSKKPEKVSENASFQKLHDFIMHNYIKKRYREKYFSERDIEAYSDLFRMCIDVWDKDRKKVVDKNIFDFVREDVLTIEKENLIKIVGPDGTGKSTFLSILYIYLYRYCLNNDFSFYPFYINLHFYDTVIDNALPNEFEVKDKMYKDLSKLLKLVEEYPKMPYIIIIDGNENYFRTTLKYAKYFDDFINKISAYKKIVCIGEKTNVHIYRERKNYPYMYSRMYYTFRFKSIKKIYGTEKWEKFVKIYTTIEGNGDLLTPINEYLDKFDLDEIDLNLLSVFKDCYDSDMLNGLCSVSDLYKNYCMAYLKDVDDFEDSAWMSYDYFMTSKKFTQDEIANRNKEWNLIHQHKTISNFLIAYYYVGEIKNFNENRDTKNLEYLFPRDVNIFIKPLINDGLETQKLILDKCKLVYAKGGILAKSQALYMMGRITHQSLRVEILNTLENYYEDLNEKLDKKKIAQTEQDKRDLHLILRSVIISLVYLGKKDKREAYLKMLLNYPVANQINRGFHLEYYGDVPRKPDSRIYNYNDDGTGEIDITYNIILDRIEHYLSSEKGAEDLNFQINLFTLCSLIQVRFGKENLSDDRMKNLKRIIDTALKKEQSNINIDFKAYLTMLKEDIENRTYKPYCLYEKLYGIKNIERKGWRQEIKNDTVKQPFENDVEHIYYTWMLGMIYLPEEPPKEKDYRLYDKRKILDTILIHDWAEIDVGDVIPKEDTDDYREEEDFRMRILLMHDTYDQISNMSRYKEAWNVYKKDTNDINGKIAYELDKIQALYQFYEYQNKRAKFTDEKILDWKNEKNKIITSLGKKILEEVVLNKFENKE